MIIYHVLYFLFCIADSVTICYQSSRRWICLLVEEVNNVKCAEWGGCQSITCYNGDFLYSAHTMLYALHTHNPWSLDLFIHEPFQLLFIG